MEKTPEQILLTYRCMCVRVLGVLKASSPPPPNENGSVFTLALDLDCMAQPLTPY